MRRYSEHELQLLPAVESNRPQSYPSVQRRKRSPCLTPAPQSRCDLADVLPQAVELARNRAAARDLRVHCYCLDSLPVAAEAHELLGTLDAMLAMASDLAAWGSLIVCQTGIENGDVTLRIEFAVAEELSNGQTAIVQSDVSRVWPRAQYLH